MLNLNCINNLVKEENIKKHQLSSLFVAKITKLQEELKDYRGDVDDFSKFIDDNIITRGLDIEWKSVKKAGERFHTFNYTIYDLNYNFLSISGQVEGVFSIKDITVLFIDDVIHSEIELEIKEKLYQLRIEPVASREAGEELHYTAEEAVFKFTKG